MLDYLLFCVAGATEVARAAVADLDLALYLLQF